MKRVLRIVLAGVLVVGLGFAQEANKAQVVGTVLDPNGAVVPSAMVKIRNTATGVSRELKTSDVGQYRFPFLDPGTYELTAQAQGFSLTTMSGIVLNVGVLLTVDVKLSVQGTTTTVDVGETLLQLETNSQSALVNSKAITNLPINGRRFQDFALLTPTAVVDTQTRGQISFAGQRGIYSNIMLDGADYNQPFFGGIRGGERSGSIITVPQSAIQEFQVVPTGYTAEYGRSTGGVMNTITKSGGNDVHGEMFYQLRHRSLSKKNPVVNVRPSETLQQYGGGIGGAIKKDKLFYFGAFEGQYAKTPRQIFFAQLQGLASTPQTAPAYNFYKSQEGPLVQDNKAYAGTAKIDYAFAAGHRLTFRYNISDSTENNAVTVGGQINPISNFAASNEGTEKDRIHNGTMQYTHLFSPTFINDTRFTGSYEVRPRLANENVPTVENSIGNYGARSFLPTTQDDRRWQLSNTSTITKGRHTFKFGPDLNFLSTGQLFGFNQFGRFQISGNDRNQIMTILSGNGTNGANRFDSPLVTYLRQIGNLEAVFNMQQLGWFVQDSWKVNSKLTIDLGLRWELQLNPRFQGGNQALIDRVNNVRFPNSQLARVDKINDTLDQIMPRFGLAYSPFGNRRMVIRGFSGVFYGATPMLSFSGPTNNFRIPPGDVSIQVGGAGTQLSVYQAFLQAGVNLNSATLDKLPVIPVDVVQRASAIALGGSARDPFIGANVVAMASDFRNPRSVQSGFGVESEVLRNFTAGVQFNVVNTVNLLRNRDYNLPAPILLAGDATQRPNFGIRNAPGIRPAVPRPVSTVGQLTVRESSARSLYRSAVVTLQYRTKRLQLQGFYTLSENFSDDDNERDTGGTVAESQFNYLRDYNYSLLDSRHQFTGNGVYTLPWGFEVGGIVRYRSGLPINPRTGNDENQDNNFTDRPTIAPGVTMARNSFRNRSFTTTDLRVMKNFGVGEGKKIQFSVEFFNLFNAENVAFVNTSVNAIYGPGLLPNGTTAPVDPRFQRLRLPDGRYDPVNQQVGSPLQVQGALRFFF